MSTLFLKTPSFLPGVREHLDASTLMIQQGPVPSEWQGRLIMEDLRASSPLKGQHVNAHGTFTLKMSERLPLAAA